MGTLLSEDIRLNHNLPGVFVTFGHAFGQRYDLPIPLLLFVLGGAAIVFASFLLVLPMAVKKQLNTQSGDEALLRRYRWPWSALSYVVFGLLMAAGLLGSQVVSENILPTIFWLIVWIVVPLLCGIFGDWTQGLNPFAHIAKLADSPRLRHSVLGGSEPLKWPAWLGSWPAVVLFFVLACGELIYNQTATLPAVIAGSLLGYFAISAIMGFLFGGPWLKRGEVFTVLFSTWGRLSFARPARALTTPFDALPSRIIFVLLLLVSVSFDGLLATPAWNKLQLSLPPAIHTGSLSLKLVVTLAFILLIALVGLLFGGFAVVVARFGRIPTRSGGTRKVLAGLLCSLLPISFGYLLAHNLQYVLVNGQLLLPLLGNPVGMENWPLHLPYPFNDSFEPNLHILPSAAYWYIAVVVIVVVHIVAVVLAHRYLVRVAAGKRQNARRSEYPWILAMVVYTMLSLWLLAQPLVN